MAYFDETKAQEAKDKGNEFFKKGAFPDAIKAYEEGLKRTADGDCVSFEVSSIIHAKRRT